MLCENYHFTDFFTDQITAAGMLEILIQHCLIHVFQKAFRIYSLLRRGYCILIHVRGKYLDVCGNMQEFHAFAEQDCQGIRLLARGTGDAPHTDRFLFL